MEVIFLAGKAQIYCGGIFGQSDAPFGLGIAFTALQTEEREKLEQLVNSLQVDQQFEVH